MNIYKNLLFLHGYLTDPREADIDEASVGTGAETNRNEAIGDDADIAHGVGHAAPAPTATAMGIELSAAREQSCFATASTRAAAQRPVAALATPHPVERLFGGMFRLAALEPAASRLGLDDDRAYGQSFGNRIASQRIFGRAIGAHARTAAFASDRATCACG